MRCTLLCLGFLPLICAAELQINASRGPAVLEEQGCTRCHSIGSGGTGVSATTLGRTLNREYSPAGLTATLWNHAPQMWSQMAAQGVPQPTVSVQEAADLFGYFGSLRYFEPMGDAARGARLFRSEKCAECHAAAGQGSSAALPVSQWDSVSDPVALVGKMWNHVPQMRAEMAKRGIRWPSLNSQELSDILVYARSLRQRSGVQTAHFELPPLEGGQSLLEQWGCATCHTGELAFGRGMSDRSLTDVAAAMWNHGPKMVQNPAMIPQEEMRKILSWIWARQFFQPSGNPGRGRDVAQAKKCSGCHEGGGAPPFAKFDKPFSVIQLTSGLWRHGPEMLKSMQAKGVSWPRLTAADVENLVAYVESVK